MPHVIFKEKLDAKLEQLLQVNLKKLPKRIRGSIRRSPTQIIRSEDVEEEEEDGEEEEEDVEPGIPRTCGMPSTGKNKNTKQWLQDVIW